MDIPLNKGSDLRWSGIWRDKETGAAINLTGYAVSLFDPHAFLVGKLTVTITNAVTGAFAMAMDWDAEMDGDFDLERMLKEDTEACYPSATHSPRVEPEVYRKSILETLATLKDKEEGRLFKTT